jgi:hypothetical protein
MMDGGEGDGFVGGGEWAVELCSDEFVFCGAGCRAGEGAVPARPGGCGGGDFDFAGADAALVEGPWRSASCPGPGRGLFR